MATSSDPQNKSLNHLTKSIEHVAHILEQQNKPLKKFTMGVVFGVGTALGASIIASLIIFILLQILQATGIQTNPFTQDAKTLIENQLKLQTPQN